ncbi:hypothetical protein BT96DRAFT_968929 [Gymnopus androsaceus JB14]|uniref:Uncharacterized protein n=1 Tax=Gymnopus androsaceus JB14 TaxID=1447944 RepID=A0A6A4IUB1_9AGAR|nr:hypothetical protein BT96DRAFT_968929 [Gymnopus androsaceus JB14]
MAFPSAAPDARKLSLNDDLHNPRRVVIEASPNGESFWRFVPKAHRDDGVNDEGDWPRVIDICGTLYECSQDQWDIYKLDPFYECRVCAPPALTTITRVTPKPPESPPKQGKRGRAGIPPLNPRKKINTGNVDSDDDEVEEVEDMVIDQSMPPPRARSTSVRLRKKREDILRGRQAEKREFIASAEPSPERYRSESVPSENVGKRKATLHADPLRSPDTEYAPHVENEFLRTTFTYEQTHQGKRTRKASPGAARRELDIKRAQRERRRQERQQAKVDGHKQQWHERFMQEVYAEVPDLKPPSNGLCFAIIYTLSMMLTGLSDAPSQHNGNGNADYGDDDDDSEEESFTGGPSTDTSFDEDAMRSAAIAESRRKLAELEADRPLWEAEARKRALRQKAEEEAERLKAEERKWAESRQADEKRQAEARRKAQEAREKQEEEQRQREEAAKRQRERQQRQQRWAYGPWTTQRALERYKALSEAFDTTKFNNIEPVSFDIVPWPVLASPARLSVEDIDWNAVEKFFDAVRPHMRTQDFKVFVEKSHRRFHPDRWRSRGLLKTVADEAEKGCLEVGTYASMERYYWSLIIMDKSDKILPSMQELLDEIRSAKKWISRSRSLPMDFYLDFGEELSPE